MTFSKLLVPLLALCLTFGQLAAVPARAQEGPAEPRVTPTEMKPETLKGYVRLLTLAERIMGHKTLYAYLNDQLRPLRQIPEKLQLRYGWPAESKGLTLTQIAFLLQRFPDEWTALENYLRTVTEENLKEPAVVEMRARLRDHMNRVLADEKSMKLFVSMNTPTEPLRLQAADGAMAFTEIKTYVNHPSLKNPADPSAGVIPADDMKQVIIDTIATARKSIDVNVFEFNLMDIAEALIRQGEQGREVRIGIDKTTIDLSPANRAVWGRLQAAAAANPKFKVHGVDSVGLNHQKIVVIDGGEAKARTVFSSGNFTQSCIGPEGDQVDVPKDVRSAKSIPNANHLIVVEGALPALITQIELRKTIERGLRGRDYPVSGGYIFDGPVDPKLGIPMRLIVAFSPNGGMGEINRDITKRLILSTKQGEILAMHFAFSSPELVDALQQKIIAGQTDGSGFAFRSVGDPPFAVQFWSGFLKLSGLTFDKTTETYSVDPESPLVKNLSPEALKSLQDGIRMDPGLFGEFHEKAADGTDRKISVKLHHKVFLNPAEHWAVIGTSFNPSGSAESNQEQWVMVKDSKSVERIHGAFEYLYDRAGKNPRGSSVANYADLRNRRRLGALGDGGDDAESKPVKKANASRGAAPLCSAVFAF